MTSTDVVGWALAGLLLADVTRAALLDDWRAVAYDHLGALSIVGGLALEVLLPGRAAQLPQWMDPTLIPSAIIAFGFGPAGLARWWGLLRRGDGGDATS